MVEVHVDYLPYLDIANEALAFAVKYGIYKEIPVDIEGVIVTCPNFCTNC